MEGLFWSLLGSFSLSEHQRNFIEFFFWPGPISCRVFRQNYSSHPATVAVHSKYNQTGTPLVSEMAQKISQYGEVETQTDREHLVKLLWSSDSKNTFTGYIWKFLVAFGDGANLSGDK